MDRWREAHGELWSETIRPGDHRMLVVVTGANGFVGRNLQAWLSAQGHEVVGAARSLHLHGHLAPFEPHSPSFRDLLKRQPDALVHAAGSALVNDSFADPKRDFESNVSLFQAVLEAVRLTAPSCRVVLVSSAAVYGNPVTQPITEDTPIAPISPYAYHKAMAEDLGRMYHEIFGLRTCAVRVFSAYGQGLQRQVVYDAIRALRASGPGRPAVFRGSGQEARDFIHVEDVAHGVDAVLRSAGWTGEPYNLASGVSTTIAELVEIVRAELGPPSEALFDGRPQRGHPLGWQADISRIRALGFTPARRLRDGIVDLIGALAPEANPLA